jgi:hypothetical protein
VWCVPLRVACVVWCGPLRVAPLTGLGDMGRRFSFVRRRTDAPRPAVDSTSENASVRVSDVLGAVPGQLAWSDPPGPPLTAPVSCFGDDTTAGSGMQGRPGGSQLPPFPLTRPTAVRSDWQRAPAKSSPTTVRPVPGEDGGLSTSESLGHRDGAPTVSVVARRIPDAARITDVPADPSHGTCVVTSTVGQRDRSSRVEALRLG